MRVLEKLRETLNPDEPPALLLQRQHFICKLGHDCPGISETTSFQKPAWMSGDFEFRGVIKYLQCAWKGYADRLESCEMPHILEDKLGEVVCICGDKNCWPSTGKRRLLFLVRRSVPEGWEYHLRPYPQSEFERRLKKPEIQIGES